MSGWRLLIVETSLVVSMAGLLGLEAGWLGILTTPFGMGPRRFAVLLASPLALILFSLITVWSWWRAPPWSESQERQFWRRPVQVRVAFLALHWPLPLGMILSVQVAREVWDRLPFDQAVASHTRFIRLAVLALLLAALWFNVCHWAAAQPVEASVGKKVSVDDSPSQRIK